MKTLISGLLCLLFGMQLAAQTTPQTHPDSGSSKPPTFPAPRPYLAVAVYGDSTGDTTRRDSMVRYYLFRNLHPSTAIRLDAPTAFPLTGAGQTVSLALSSDGRPLGQQEIAPGRQRLVRVVARLPVPGRYRGAVELPYRYTRGDSTFTGLVNLGLGASRSDRKIVKTYPFFRIEPIGIVLHEGRCPVRLRVVIRDTSGFGGRMRIPLIMLQQTIGDTGVQARKNAYEIFLEPHSLGQKALGPFLDFEPYEAKRLVVVYPRLSPAEVYAGRVVLQGDTFREVSQPFTMRLRRSIWYAVVVITLGLLLAWIAKYLHQRGTPSLRQRLQLLRVQEQIEQAPEWSGQLDDQEQTTLEVLLGFVSALQRQVDQQPLADADFSARIANFQARIALFRQVIAFRVALAGSDPASADFATVQATHVDFLRVPGKTAEELTAQKQAIINAEADRREALRNQLQAACKDLSAMLVSNQGFIGAGQIEALTPAIQAAAVAQPLQAALAAYAQVRLRAGKALCLGFDTLIKGPSFPAGAWTDEAWHALSRQCQTALAPGLNPDADADQALQAYNDVMKAFTTAMNAQLTAKGYTWDNPEGGDNAVRLAAWMKAAPGTAVDPQVNKGLTPDRDGSTPRSLNLTGQPSVALTMAPATAVAMGGVMEEVAVPDLARRIRRTSLLLLATELVYTLIVLLLSVILGIQILYLGDDAWGSVQDIFVAFTWGFGIHAITRNTDLGQKAFDYVNGKINGSGAAS